MSVKCSKCEAELAADDRFCSKCGTTVDQSEHATEVLPPLPSMPEAQFQAVTKQRPSAVPEVSAGALPVLDQQPRQEIVLETPAGPPAPPMPPIDGHEDGPSDDRRKWIIGGSIVAAAVAIAAALVVFVFSGNSDRAESVALLTEAHDKTAEVMRRVSVADTIGKLKGAGGFAATAAAGLAEIEREADAIEDPAIARPTAEYVRAQKRYASKFDRLQRLEKRQLGRWTGIKDQVIDASRNILARAEGVEALKLDVPPEAPIMITRKDLTQATNSANKVIESGQRRMRAYDREVAAWRAKQQRAVAPFTNYQANVNGILAEYAQARTVTDRFMSSASSLTDMDAADESLMAQIRTRDALASRIRALSVPPGMGTTHNDVVGLIQDAITAMANASMATWEYRHSPGTLTQQDSWSDFERLSDEVAGRYDATMARWRGQVAQAVETAKRVARRGGPPSVPEI